MEVVKIMKETRYLVTYDEEYEYCEFTPHDKYFATLAEAYSYYKILVREYLAKPDEFIAICLIKFDEEGKVKVKLKPPYLHERYGE